MIRSDSIRLRHMLEAAQEALSYLAGRERSELDNNRMLVHSLVRCITVIGEAAVSVSPECRAQMPGVPWPNIVGMRNRLVHAYFDIDLDLVWNTVEDDLPPLIAELEKTTSPPDS